LLFNIKGLFKIIRFKLIFQLISVN